METCKQHAAPLPDEWVMGKLDPLAAADFEEHLMTCAACQEAVEAARGLRRGLALVAAGAAARSPAGTAPVKTASARRWLAAAALLPLAAISLFLLRQQNQVAGRLAASEAEVARLAGEAREAREEGQEARRQGEAAEARRQELEAELDAARRAPAARPATAPARMAAPLVDLPTFLLATVRDRPAGADLVLRRSDLGAAFNLAIDLPDPSFDRFRFEIKHQGRSVLARKGLAASALDALLLTLPADFLPAGENQLTLYGEGPGRPEQELARFRLQVDP